MAFGAALGAIGSGISAIGSIGAGQAAMKAGAFEASALREQARETIIAANYNAAEMRRLGQQDLAAAQRKAQEDKRQEQYIQSKVQAYAAASGGGAQDPTVVNVQKQIAQQGEYSALSDLFSGQSQKVALQNQANLTEYVGQMQAAALQNQASYVQMQSQAAGQGMILGGIGGLFGSLAKFG